MLSRISAQFLIFKIIVFDSIFVSEEKYENSCSSKQFESSLYTVKHSSGALKL